MTTTSKETSTRILPHIDPGNLNYIIYHKDCPDGFGAAYSAWKRLGNNATYYPAVHNTPPPDDVKDKNIGLFDFAYSRSILTEVENQAKSLAIVDHHKSARDELLGDHSVHSENRKNYFFDMNKSGARLAWEFFWPDREVPLLIRYIEDKDLWRFSLPKSREFSTFWSTVPHEFETYDRYVKDESLIEKAIESGGHILNYMDSRISSMEKRDAFKRKMTVTTIDSNNRSHTKTYNVFAINSPLWQSDLGHTLVKKEGVDFSIVYFYDGNLRRYGVSLRSLNEKADVSLIAKAMGGGGHRNPDWIGLNAGIFLIRNCEWSHKFLEKWMEFGAPENSVASKKALNKVVKSRPQEWGPDDQSALVYLLNKNKTKSEENVYLETSYVLHGYFEYIIDKFQDFLEGKEKQPFITHFSGCNFCGGGNVTERCHQGFDRAFIFADNQFLSSVGRKHSSLTTTLEPISSS